MASYPSIADDPLRALLDAAVDAIVLIDAQGLVVGFNRSAEQLFGYRAAEVHGCNVSMLMPQPYRGEHDAYIDRYAHTGERRIIGIGREVVAQRKDGSTFPIDLSVGEFSNAGVRGYVGILRDISERKRHEAMLRQNGEELRRIFEYAPTAMTTTDLEGHILRANRACAELLGCRIEELVGKRHSDLVHAEDRPRLLAAYAQLREEGGEFRQEFRYPRRDGTEMQALLYSAAVADDGRQQMIISELVDRSALLAANREAEALRGRLTHAARVGQLGEMVSGIAHEVNQPLTAIANYAHACRRLLQSGDATPADLIAPLEKIATQAERAGQVIRGLRTLARRGETPRQTLQVNQLVREVLPLIEFDARQAGIRLRMQLATGLPPVHCDEVQIQQVVLNLVRNAVEAMNGARSSDVIDIVTSTQEPRFVEIVVMDSGPGIAPEAADRLFEPFYTTKPQGMGLGLSICQSIAIAHGGELSYYVNERAGATFALRLPRLD
ncbi:PAS domain-containing sensor histidine kinase [Solimonas soli]|uniref:PAS domain-containing sensor histidine kinase n=1 Tax=Solimonas soli TaxID=413479 RepID=UPI0004B2CD3E|nr:PAS domain-containing sensor histidine kinase [Solimonas soli]